MTIHLPPDGRLRAITIREPFATLIAMGIKTVENRVMPVPTSLTLPMAVAVHASSDESQMGDDCNELCKDSFILETIDNMTDEHGNPGEVGVLGRDVFYCQNIVGLVDIIACVNVHELDNDAFLAALAPYEDQCPQVKPRNSYEEWANGPYCYLLANPRRFRQGVLCRGQLGLWRLPPDIQDQVIAHAKDLLTDPQRLPLAPAGGVAKCSGKPAAASR